jgi:replicative DNA helicase
VFLALARYYRNEGQPKEVVYHTLKGISELNQKLYPESAPYTKVEIWNQSIASAFSEKSIEHLKPGSPGTTASDPILLEYCREIDSHSNRQCSLHKKVLTREVYNSDEMATDFSCYAKNIEKMVISTGIKFIDDNAIISRSEVTTIVGAIGSGKTSISLNLLENASEQSIPSVFFSLDMVKPSLFLKLALRSTKYSQSQIKYFYKNDPVRSKEITDAVKEKFKHVHFVFASTMTMEQIRDRIFQINDSKKIELGLAICDYFGRVSSDFSDQFASLNYSALKSKEIADTTNTAFILLSQISRGQGDSSAPLRSARCSKGTGAIDEVSSVILNAWRPFMNQKDSSKDKYMRMYCAKSRMGQQKEGLLRWEGCTGKVYNMTEEELEQYSIELEKEEEDLYKNRR